MLSLNSSFSIHALRITNFCDPHLGNVMGNPLESSEATMLPACQHIVYMLAGFRGRRYTLMYPGRKIEERGFCVPLNINAVFAVRCYAARKKPA